METRNAAAKLQGTNKNKVLLDGGTRKLKVETMKISVKLLKGDVLEVQADESETVLALKTKIEGLRSELGADRQRLIHSGKILKDDSTVGSIGILETDFLVCMVTKEVAKPKPAPAPAPVVPAPTPAPAAAVAAPATSAPAQVAQAAAQPNYVTADSLAALVGMGFPEAESRAALNAAQGNPNLAYEFLLTGIPQQSFAPQGFSSQSAAPAPVAAVPAPAATTGIQQLRSHPQFNSLKQLIQANPASLPQVLNLIGQQSPALLEAIHQNESEFLAMMNEPIGAAPPAAPTSAATAPGFGNPNQLPQLQPAQLLQALSAMPPGQRDQFMQAMGMNPDQLNMLLQMMAQNPEQMEQMLADGDDHDHDHGAHPEGTVMLSHEEMESVQRLMALGFTQQQAAQAFLACDRNETLAANFLFENGEFGDDYDDGDDAMN